MKTRIITDEELIKLGEDPEKYTRVFYHWSENLALDTYQCYDELCEPIPSSMKEEYYDFIEKELMGRWNYEANFAMDEIASEFAKENKAKVDKVRRSEKLKGNLEKRLGGVK